MAGEGESTHRFSMRQFIGEVLKTFQFLLILNFFSRAIPGYLAI